MVGRDVRLGWTGQRYTIVGVMPRGFSFFDRATTATRAQANEASSSGSRSAFTAAQQSDSARTRYGFFHVGRLRPGATIEQVQAQVDALNAANVSAFRSSAWPSWACTPP